MNTCHKPISRRAVVTGLGVLAPNGCTVDSFWESLVSGLSGVRTVKRFQVQDLPCKLGAEIEGFIAEEHLGAKLGRKHDRAIALGMAAAKMAFEDAGLRHARWSPERAGLIEGTSLGNVETAYKGRINYDLKGYRGVSPSAMLDGHLGGGSAQTAIMLGLRGFAQSLSTSSASGGDVVGAALHAIRSGEADLVLAGAAEAPLIDTIWAGFCQMRVLTRAHGDPAHAVKAFDEHSDGFALGEGAAYLVVEELGHALARGAKIYAEVAGFGRSTEAMHGMAPSEDGDGPKRSMRAALADAGLGEKDVDMVMAHGSANKASDVAECRAMHEVFEKYPGKVAMTAIKGMTGHCLSAAGAIESVACALSLSRAVIPPIVNLKNPIDSKLDFVRGAARRFPARVALNINSGFGGKNSCVVFRHYQQHTSRP